MFKLTVNSGVENVKSLQTLRFMTAAYSIVFLSSYVCVCNREATPRGEERDLISRPDHQVFGARRQREDNLPRRHLRSPFTVRPESLSFGVSAGSESQWNPGRPAVIKVAANSVLINKQTILVHHEVTSRRTDADIIES